MIKADTAVKRETKYIAYFSIVLSLFLQGVFLVLKKWDYTVLLGNLLSLLVTILNFYLMGISVQKALSLDSSDAKKLMKSSQGMRNLGIFIAVVIGVVVPCFNTAAVIVPIFFPRIAVFFRPFIKDKDKKEVIDR